MSRSFHDDLNAAFANGQATAGALEERFRWTLEKCRQDTPTRFDTLDRLQAHLANHVAPEIEHHRAGWTVSVFEPEAVCGPNGLLRGPAVAVHRAQDPDVHAAAVPIRHGALALPHLHTMREIANLGVDAFDAAERTVAAAGVWDVTARVAAQLGEIVDGGSTERDGVDVLQAWVNLTDDGYYAAAADSISVRYAPGGGTNLDADDLAEHHPWERFAIWEPGNTTLHIAHSGPDPAGDNAQPDIVASIDDQSALRADSVRVVAAAAALTLRDQLSGRLHYQSWLSTVPQLVVPAFYDPAAKALPLRCLIAEPDVSLVDAALRPPHHTGLGLVADPDAYAGVGWAADPPAESRSPELAL